MHVKVEINTLGTKTSPIATISGADSTNNDANIATMKYIIFTNLFTFSNIPFPPEPIIIIPSPKAILAWKIFQVGLPEIIDRIQNNVLGKSTRQGGATAISRRRRTKHRSATMLSLDIPGSGEVSVMKI